MRPSSDVKGYNAGAMLLHWAIALAILLQLGVGFAMSRLEIFPDALRFALFQWHKTIGLLVLALTFARIGWRLLNPPPAHGPMPRHEVLLAGAVHALLYASMLLVPLTGWLLVSASPTKIPTLLFLSEHLPWPHLPVPVSMEGTVEEVAETLHITLAYATAALLVLHIAGALKHSLIDRAPSLSRIVPTGNLPRQSTALLAVPLAAGLAAAFLAGGVAVGRDQGSVSSAPAAIVTSVPASGGWIVDHRASSIRYEVAFSGKPAGGAVERWNAAITFDPADPAAGSAKISIDAASLSVADPFLRSNLPGPDGFDTASHPTIEVVFDRFERDGDGFLGQGTLALKNKSAPVLLRFALEPLPDGSARVTGRAEIDRLAYDVGKQNDPTGQWLGKIVTVSIDLVARRADAPGAGS